MYKLDKIDKELLRLLQANGRATISSLSEAVSLSMPAVSERVKRLESSGVIQKFTAMLNPSLVDKQLMALVQIGFKLHILSFVADSPFYRESLFIPELQRIVNWFFVYGPNTPEAVADLGA